MRVLITGSSGRIGEVVASRIAEEHSVIGLDLIPGRMTGIVGDIRDQKLLSSVCPGVEAVIHTASLHAPHVRIRSDAEFRSINVQGTRCLLDACLRFSIHRFIYTSTTSLYGNAMIPTDQAVWVDEELKPIPLDIYDETKIAAEELCRAASKEGVRCTSLRMSRCFPEAEDLMAIYRLYRGVDSRDVADAHHLALLNDPAQFAIFNISAQSPFEQGDMTDLYFRANEVISRNLPWAQEEFARKGWKLPTSIDRVYSILKAQTILGYRPRHNFASLFGR